MQNDLISRNTLDIELQNLVKEYNRNCESDKSSGAFEALYRLRLSPTVDAVEVVRCKDCKLTSRTKNQPKILYWCNKFGNVMRPDDYCSFGERKEGDQL